MLTRGRHANHLYLQVVGDGDPHTVITRDALLPPPPPTSSSASWPATTPPSPRPPPNARARRPRPRRLRQPPPATSTPSPRRRRPPRPRRGSPRSTPAPTASCPGLTRREAWPTLRAHLVLLAADGHDPTGVLIARRRPAEELAPPATRRRPGLAPGPDRPPLDRSRAAALAARASPPPSPPTRMGRLPDRPRADLVADLARQVAADARAWTPTSAPGWARPTARRPRRRRDLVADLAVWRAATGVPDSDRRPTGPPTPGCRRRRAHQQRARPPRQRRRSATRAPPPAGGHRSPTASTRASPPTPTGRPSPTGSARAERAGIDIATLTRRVAHDGPLPDEQPAAALWWRLAATSPPPPSPPTTTRDRHAAPRLDPRPRRPPRPAEPQPGSSPTRPGRPWSPPSPRHQRRLDAHEVLDTAHQLLAAGQPDNAPLATASWPPPWSGVSPCSPTTATTPAPSTANPSTSRTTGTPHDRASRRRPARPSSPRSRTRTTPPTRTGSPA